MDFEAKIKDFQIKAPGGIDPPGLKFYKAKKIEPGFV
jgi:hypothetical protein